MSHVDPMAGPPPTHLPEDPATAEMWLRSVQQDPSSFLAIKFGMQLQREEDAR